MNDSITGYELKIIRNILSNEIHQFFIFGSRANNTYHKTSDLDIVVYSNEKLSILYIDNLKEMFSESDLPYMVDIIDYNSCSNTFKKIIDNTINKDIKIK